MNCIYSKRVSAGLCYRCGEKCSINKRTGKPFHACLKHRVIEAARFTRRRNGGIGRRTGLKILG